MACWETTGYQKPSYWRQPACWKHDYRQSGKGIISLEKFGNDGQKGYLCLRINIFMAVDIAKRIKDTALAVMPENGKVILFGSRARGNWHEGSDWDLLVLLDKDCISESDHERYAYPFWELGWDINAMIHPIIYTMKEWNARRGSEFYDNVISEGVVIC